MQNQKATTNQFISSTGYSSWDLLRNFLHKFSGKFMDNCWISRHVMADMKKVYDDLIIINL